MMRPRFTAAGQALQARAMAGVQIVFTRIELGDGELGEADYKQLTALISPKVSLPLTGIQVLPEKGEAVVRGEFSNVQMTEGFFYREQGLYAKDPDDPTKEILYCYANFGHECQYIAEPSSALISRVVSIVAVVDDAPNVTAVLNEHAEYITYQDLMQYIAQHNHDEGAHPNLVDFDVRFFIDPDTEDDEDTRDGTAEHPFISISEALDNTPLSALRAEFILAKNGVYYNGIEVFDTIGGFQQFWLHPATTSQQQNAPVIVGGLAFSDCSVVYISSVDFVGANMETNPNARINALSFARCACVQLDTISGTQFSEAYGSVGDFVFAQHSSVSAKSLTCTQPRKAFWAMDHSRIAILSGCSVAGGTYGLYASGASEIRYPSGFSPVNSADTPFYVDDCSVLLSSLTAADISSDAIHTHLNNTASNPHQVSLDDAQNYGGTVNVEHGGTGKTSFDAGAILKGNGANNIAQILGAGALFSLTSGDPMFGTLPVSMGGTGQTSIPNAYKSPMNGAHYGYFFIPGTDYMIGFGRVSMEAGDSFTWGFEGYFDNHTMTDDKYVLIFSNDDIETSHVTKYSDRFEISSFVAGTRVADFVLIGQAVRNPVVS